MHAEAMEAVRRMVNVSGYISSKGHTPADTDRMGLDIRGRTGLDIGGADVNGSARGIIPDVDAWYGLDIAEGEGVDLVADATDATAMSAYHELFDVVLCTEVLEHVKDWRGVLDNAWTVLAPGGFAFFTFAATDTRTWARRPHGARGELDVPNGEHYANVIVGEFAAHLVKLVDRDIEISQQLVELTVDDDQGRRAEMTVNPNPGDVYAWFRK